MPPGRNTHGAFTPEARTSMRTAMTDGRTMLDLLLLSLGLVGFALMGLYAAGIERV
jgi:hypothetical protein